MLSDVTTNSSRQQDRSEVLDRMLSDVTTNSSRTDLKHLIESRQMLSQTDDPAMSLNISRHKGCTKPVEVLSYLSKGQHSLHQPNIQLLEHFHRPPSIILYNEPTNAQLIDKQYNNLSIDCTFVGSLYKIFSCLVTCSLAQICPRFERLRRSEFTVRTHVCVKWLFTCLSRFYQNNRGNKKFVAS